MNLTQIALQAARAFSPKLAEKAESELKKYPANKEGLQKLVDHYGGEAFVNSAVDFANKAPRVNALFKRFGVKPEALKETVMKNLNKTASPSNSSSSEHNKNPANSFKDRLNKLR